MKKKSLILLVILFGICLITGCEKHDYAKEFKEDYESVNGKANASGKIYREVTISEDNKFIKTTPEEIVKMIDNEETFYVYFGSKLCPWCRSSIEKADEIIKDNGIDKVYYVDIWDDNGEEIVRDKYTLNEDDELELVKEGLEAYKKLIVVFNDLLDDYTLTDSNGKTVSTGEKRIYAPNYIYVQKGKGVRITTGLSDKQKGARDELTEEILKDEEEKFNNFFLNYCDDLC